MLLTRVSPASSPRYRTSTGSEPQVVPPRPSRTMARITPSPAVPGAVQTPWIGWFEHVAETRFLGPLLLAREGHLAAGPFGCPAP